MITLYWGPNTRAERMFWALEEIGQDYRLELADFRDPGTFSEGFLAASPLRKVPALSDGEVHLADTAAIVMYLADRYAPGVLAPAPDSPDRGAYLYWTVYGPSAFEPAMVAKVVDIPANPATYPWGDFDRMMGAVETRMDGREWIVGDSFTMADFMIGGSLKSVEDFRMATLPPALRTYVERCHARPAALRGAEKLAAAKAAL